METLRIHDTKRKKATKNDKVTRNDLVRNGKFFVAAQQSDKPFKTLFAELAAQGAGRPVDERGFPDGPWTAESLTDAICALEGNDKGIELRTVQRWFQDNDQGIRHTNIRWLARIFGCEDPEEVGKWQAVLSAAKDLQTKLRRANKTPDSLSPLDDAPSNLSVSTIKKRPFPTRIALRINAMLTGSNNIYVIIMLWGLWSILGMSAIILGLAEVSYITNSGTEKQVGLFQSPSWTLEKLVLIPAYLIITTRGVIAWLDHRRAYEYHSGLGTWEDRVASFAPAFLLVIAVSAIVIFALQWYGTYYVPLMAGPESDLTPNWLRVATDPTTIIPTRVIVPLSLYGGMFIGFVYWLCFSALLLLYIAARDITAIYDDAPDTSDFQQTSGKLVAARDLVTAFYRSIICGALMNIAIKVDALYFISDTESFFTWLKLDLLAALGVDGGGWTWLPGGEFSSFTTAIFLLIITAVAYFGIYRIKLFVESTLHQAMPSHAELFTVPAFLNVTYVLLGEFTGFTLLLVASFLIGIMQLVRPATQHPRNPSAGE